MQFPGKNRGRLVEDRDHLRYTLAHEHPKTENEPRVNREYPGSSFFHPCVLPGNDNN